MTGLKIKGRVVLTQRELAEKFNVSIQAINNLSRRNKFIQGKDWDYINKNKEVVNSYKGHEMKVFYKSGVAKLSFHSNSKIGNEFKEKSANLLGKEKENQENSNQIINTNKIIERLENLEKIILEQRPFVDFANSYLSKDDNSLTLTEFSNLISKQGLYFSSNTLLKYLITNNIFTKRKAVRSNRNLPKTEFIKNGWFELTRQDITRTLVLIKPKGQLNLLNLIKNNKMIEVENKEGQKIFLPEISKEERKLISSYKLNKEDNTKLSKIIKEHWLFAEIYKEEQDTYIIDIKIKNKIFDRYQTQSKKGYLFDKFPNDKIDADFVIKKIQKISKDNNLFIY